MRLSGIIEESIVDGPGFRIVLFTQGCHHGCPHCQNPETWDINAGQEFSVKEVIRIIRKNRKNKQGITFSGGEPFLQSAELAEVARLARGFDFDIVTYTGFTYEELLTNENTGTKLLLDETDILIDGKYIHKLRDISLQYRGSSNQRIIDVKKSMEEKKVITTNYAN